MHYTNLKLIPGGDLIHLLPNSIRSSACVRGSPMVPLVGNICTICINLITNGTIGKEIGANVKNGTIPLVPMVQMLPTNGTIGRTPQCLIL